MANYLYNGVELPALPEWDKETHPYSLIYRYDSTENYWLVIADKCPYVEFGGISTYSDEYCLCWEACHKFIYKSDGGEFSYSRESNFEVVNGFPFSLISTIWTSVDVLNKTDSNIYLAASEPVPVREYPIASEVTLSPQSVEVTAGQAQDIQFTLTGTDGTDYTGIATWAYAITDKNGTVSKDDAPWVSWVSAEDGSVLLRITADAPGGHEITVIAAWGTEDDPQDLWAIVTVPVKRVSEQWLYSFKMGLALGLAGKPLPIEKEPAAYLYNGVRLPKLRKWNKKTYPYAYIGYHGGSIYFVVHAQPLVYNLDLDRAESSEQHQQVTWGYANGAWPSDGTAGTSAGAGKMAIPSHPFWCNTDMLVKGTSTVYLAASEPVPVFE